MPAAYSVDLRRKIVEAHLRSVSRKDIAANFGVSYRFVKIFLKKYREEGTIEPKKLVVERKRKICQEHEQFILETLSAENDITLGELRDKICEKYSLSVSVSTMHRTLNRLGISRKKKTR